MSTLKVNAIRGTGASSDAISVNSTDGTCTVKATNKSNRNLVINGAMNVAQRGTSSQTTGYKTVDRIYAGYANSDEAPTFAQVDVTADTDPWNKGFRKAFKITNGNQTSGAGATDEVAMMYSIEAQDLAASGWDYTSTSSNITVSFWVKSSVAQQFQVNMRLYPASGDQKEFCFEYTPSANTWTKVTKTIPGASGNALRNTNELGMFLQFPQFYGSDYTANTRNFDTWETKNNNQNYKDYATTWYTTNDATWEITGLQVEVSDHATDFEHRSYGDELARCQRYCVDFPINSQLGLGQVYSGSGYVQLPVALPVPMRTKPSVSKNGSYWFNSNYGNSGYSGDRSVTVETPAGSAHMYRLFVAGGSDQGNATTVWCQIHDAAGTYMRLDAEL